jgi:hypothetical protein
MEPFMKFIIETEQEDDGRWLAEVLELPGVLAYGLSPRRPGPRHRLWRSEWWRSALNMKTQDL